MISLGRDELRTMTQREIYEALGFPGWWPDPDDRFGTASAWDHSETSLTLDQAAIAEAQQS